MHPAEPADIGEPVGWKIPVIGLYDQRVLDRGVESQRNAGSVLARLAAPGTIPFVQFADIVGLRTLARQQRLNIVRVGVERVVQILDCVVHQRIVDLPGELLIQFSSGREWHLHRPAGGSVGVAWIKNRRQPHEFPETVDCLPLFIAVDLTFAVVVPVAIAQHIVKGNIKLIGNSRG